MFRTLYNKPESFQATKILSPVGFSKSVQNIIRFIIRYIIIHYGMLQYYSILMCIGGSVSKRPGRPSTPNNQALIAGTMAERVDEHRHTLGGLYRSCGTRIWNQTTRSPGNEK